MLKKNLSSLKSLSSIRLACATCVVSLSFTALLFVVSPQSSSAFNTTHELHQSKVAHVSITQAEYYNDLRTQLSPAQKQSLRRLTQKFIKNTDPIKENIAIKELELELALMDINPDPILIGKTAAQLSKLNLKLEEENLNFIRTIEKDYNVTINHTEVRKVLNSFYSE